MLVSVTSLAGEEVRVSLPRFANVSALRVLLSCPVDGLAVLDDRGRDGTRSLASFDLCAAGARVLGHDEYFDRDSSVTLARRAEFSSVPAIFELLDYRDSVLSPPLFLRELHARAELGARGYRATALAMRGLEVDTIHFVEPCVGFVRQLLRRWIRGVHTAGGFLSWCECSMSTWRLFGFRDDVEHRLLHEFRRSETSGLDVCRLLAHFLEFPDEAVLRGWSLCLRFTSHGGVLELELLRDGDVDDRFPLLFGVVRLEMVPLPREVTAAMTLFRRGGSGTDNVHLHFEVSEEVRLSLDRCLRSMDSTVGAARRADGAFLASDHSMWRAYRLEVGRDVAARLSTDGTACS